MGFLAIPYPAIDPVALRLGPLSVKWYGLAYVAGLLLGRLYVKALLQQGRLWPSEKRPFTPEKVDDLLLFMTVGVLLGGRLGYVLFYQPRFFAAHPLEIAAVWNGGMSFHGALLGSIAAIYLFARRSGAELWSVMDLAAAATPMGLFFGRLANFINAELWGRPSTVPWAMVFPDAGDVPRHPSQLYEAGTEGLDPVRGAVVAHASQAGIAHARAWSPAPSWPATAWRDRSANSSASRTSATGSRSVPSPPASSIRCR